MKYDQHVVLKHLDSPVRILSFSINEIIIYAMPILLGAILDNMFLVPLVGLLLVFFIKKTVGKLPRFYFLRFLYWHLPTGKYNKMLKTNLPPSHKRLWVRR